MSSLLSQLWSVCYKETSRRQSHSTMGCPVARYGRFAGRYACNPGSQRLGSSQIVTQWARSRLSRVLTLCSYINAFVPVDPQRPNCRIFYTVLCHAYQSPTQWVAKRQSIIRSSIALDVFSWNSLLLTQQHNRPNLDSTDNNDNNGLLLHMLCTLNIVYLQFLWTRLCHL